MTNSKVIAIVNQSIMREYIPAQSEQFKLPKERIGRFFPVGTSAQTIEEMIIKALDLWQKTQKSRPG